MRKLFPIVLMCLGASGAFAQSNKDGVTVSNDPAKAAAVEKHAQELQARAAQQQAQPAAKAKQTSTASKAKSKVKKKAARPTPAAKQ